MTTTNTPRPIVKKTNPELYAEHTFHMKKAIKYTYNYVSLDDYILQNWSTKTMKQIAEDRNEYLQRVDYRVQVLKARNHIKGKATGKQKLGHIKRSLTIRLQKVEKQLEQCG